MEGRKMELRRNKHHLHNFMVWYQYKLSTAPLILRYISLDATRILKSYPLTTGTKCLRKPNAAGMSYRRERE